MSTFSTSERPKMVRTPPFFKLLTWQCASRHDGARFFDIWTSKSGPNPSVFYTFDLEMCFAPQRRTLFRHLHFQKCSGVSVFCTFWLGNVLRHNSVQFFISHLASWLRIRCFSEVTFRPSGATNHWKNKVNRDFPTFSRTCIFSLLTFSLFDLLHLLSSPPWRFQPLLFHLSILSEVWLLNFLR